MNNHEENVLTPLPENRPVSRIAPHLFRSPPQPHMCVQDTLKGTLTPCFINVMSWCKVGIPSDPSARVPLFGGIIVPLSLSSTFFKSDKEKPFIFAVAANPHVLKQSGKMAQNVQERDSLICVMLDFIEAMNKDIKFSRKFTVLKDRDLTGELKDIWTMFQAKRDANKNGCTNSTCLLDENSQPSSLRHDCPQQNVKHKRMTEEGDSCEPLPLQTEAANNS